MNWPLSTQSVTSLKFGIIICTFASTLVYNNGNLFAQK